MRCAGQIYENNFKVCLYIHFRATAIPRALRYEVCEPLARYKFYLELQTIYPRKWVRLCAEHKQKETDTPGGVSVSFYW